MGTVLFVVPVLFVSHLYSVLIIIIIQYLQLAHIIITARFRALVIVVISARLWSVTKKMDPLVHKVWTPGLNIMDWGVQLLIIIWTATKINGPL